MTVIRLVFASCLLLACGFLGEARALELGVAWVGKSGMAERVMAGFGERLEQLAPGAALDYRTELASVDELAAVVDEFEATKDGMLILRSNGAEFLAAHPPAIPTFIGAVTNPEFLGVVGDMERPDGLVTGVTYYLPYGTRLAAVAALLPPNARVHLVVEGDHPSAAIDERGTLELCPRLGLDCSVGRYADHREAAADVRRVAGRVDGFVVGSQAELLDHTAEIVAAAGDKPVFAYGEAAVEAGAVAGYVADDAELGRLLAEAVVDVLVTGRPVSAVPVRTDPAPMLVINTRAVERLSLVVPPEVLEAARLIE